MVLVGTAPERKLGSWGDFDVLPSSTLHYQQQLSVGKLILAERCLLIWGPGCRTRNRYSAPTDQDRIAGMIGRHVILIPARSTGAHPMLQERPSIFARIVTATLLER